MGPPFPPEKERKAAPVSVVIPCFRNAATLERAVASVAGQTLKPKEVLLVDDASPDETPGVMRALQDRYGSAWIRAVSLPVNGGPAVARNRGWDLASQPYIAFLDADDVWHPRKIEIQYAWMEANPDVAYSGHAYGTLAGDDFDFPPLPASWNVRPIGKAALLLSNRTATPSVMLRRDLTERFEPLKRRSEDYLLWLRLVSRGHRAARLDVPLAYLFKAVYGDGGLSHDLWLMEKGELDTYRRLHREGLLGTPAWLALNVYSLLKYVRRVVWSALRPKTNARS